MVVILLWVIVIKLLLYHASINEKYADLWLVPEHLGKAGNDNMHIADRSKIATTNVGRKALIRTISHMHLTRMINNYQKRMTKISVMPQLSE